jgi:hypothetical protein
MLMRHRLYCVKFILISVLALAARSAWAVNPLNYGYGPSFADPHGVVFDDRVYLFTSHDFSPQSRGFLLKDWRVFSSSDLVQWKLECTLTPEKTFVGAPLNECWAGFGVRKNGKYFWYFSAGPEQVGVVTADSPAGPWKDPLGKPLIPKGMVATEARDPDVLMDDDGSAYIVFGTFNYFVARLGDDMISLAEKPRPITIKNAEGPYGKDRTDDKPSLHKHNGIYYLSYSSFYATGESPYGPFTYRGSVIAPKSTEQSFRLEPLRFDRHGNFFQFHGQWYYVCNDRSHLGRNPYFRDSIMSYVHYRENGEIAPVRIDEVGVGEYDAKRGHIEAEDFFDRDGAEVHECPVGGFEMRKLTDGSKLYYPNIHNLPAQAKLTLSAASPAGEGGQVEIHDTTPDGKLLGTCKIASTGGWDKFKPFNCQLSNGEGTESLCLVFKGGHDEWCHLDWLAFAGSNPP